jgi:hypothetical protein
MPLTGFHDLLGTPGEEKAMSRLCQILPVLVLLLLAGSGHDSARPDGPDDARADAGSGPVAVADALGRLPMRFEANEGQADAGIDFLSQGHDYRLALFPNEAVIRLQPPRAAERQRESAVLRMRLLDANAAAEAMGEERLPTQTHYYIGNDPRRWHTAIPNFAKVRYESVYPGIDIVYYGNQENLEYDFIVEPGADPDAIALELLGARALMVNEAGGIDLTFDEGEMTLERPVIYQEDRGQRQIIPGAYVLRGRQVRFDVGEFDRGRPLIIDPVLTYATFFGSPVDEFANDIALAADGGFYLTGGRELDGNVDAFVARFAPGGSSLLYTAYLGGNDVGNTGGMPTDEGMAIALDEFGSAYVTGIAASVNFPATSVLSSPIRRGAVVFKLEPNGALAYSLYLGAARGLAIAVDQEGQAHVTGHTRSGLLVENAVQPAYNDADGECVTAADTHATAVLPINIGGQNCFDAFVTKLNADASALVYSTYLGGNDDDGGGGIAVDASGNAFVTGVTVSSGLSHVLCTMGVGTVGVTGVNFPLVNPIQRFLGGFDWATLCEPDLDDVLIANRRLFEPDAFVAKFSPAGELTFSTYLGGEFYEEGVGLDVDQANDVYVTGRTGGTPTGGAGFVAKLSSSTSSLAYSVELTRNDGLWFHPADIAVDASGSAWIAGHTGVFTDNAANRVFVARLTPDGSRELFNFRFSQAGTGVLRATGIAVDVEREMGYVAGYTTSDLLPISLNMNPYQLFSAGAMDAFVFRLNGHEPEITAGPTASPPIVPSEGATQLLVSATDSKGHALTYRWSNVSLTGGSVKCYSADAAGFSDSFSPNTVWTAPANFSSTPRLCGLRVIVTDTNDAVQVIGTLSITVEPAPNRPPVANAAASPVSAEQAGPEGTTVRLDGSLSSDPDGDALSYRWTGPFGTAAGVQPEVLLPAGMSTVRLVVNDGIADSAPQSIVVTIADTTPPEIAAERRPAPNPAGWNNTDVTVTFTCSDRVGVASSSDAAVVSTEGAGQSRIGTCTDAAGNTATVSSGEINIDKTAPAVTGTPSRQPNAHGWYNGPFDVVWTGADPLSGVQSCTTATRYDGPDVRTSSLTGSCHDLAGNRGDARFDFRFDATAPEIAITQPADGARFLLNQAAATIYDCADTISGVTSCAGPTPSGAALNTRIPGVHEIAVAAADAAGNLSLETISYSVAYGVCLLYDPNRAVRAGSTVPVRVQLCDAAGVNLSRPDLVVTAVQIVKLSSSVTSDVMDAGNANPDDNFRFDPGLGGGGYIFNLKTAGLTTGTYALILSVTGDPTTHASEAVFQVK